VATLGTAVLFALIAWDVSRPDTCGPADQSACTATPLSTYVFFIGAPLLGCLVAVAASGRARLLLIGVGVFFASAVPMLMWMGPDARAEGGVVVAFMWIALEAGGLYLTAGVMALVRARRGHGLPA
jgi:hypothetical protein